MYYLGDIKLVTKVNAYSQDFITYWLTKNHVKWFFTSDFPTNSEW